MAKIDLSNSIASEMDKVLNSEENKQMFSSSAVLEKLAFSRVADEGKVSSELEVEVAEKLNKTASKHECCECEESDKCECKCHDKKSASVSETVHALLKVSEDLETNGFEKLAALSIVLAEKLVVEAKAKSKSKSEKEDSKSEKSKSKSKSKSKKMTMKERMEKMRKMQKGKKSKKSELVVSMPKRGQALPPQDMKAAPPSRLEADTILRALQPNVRAAVAQLEVRPSAMPGQHSVLVKFKPGGEKAFDAIQGVVQQLQNANQLPAKSYTIKQVA
jgi:hypothetical protein